MAFVIETREVSKNYRRREETVHALRNVNFSVAPGEFVAVIGASGSGKSTLMHILGCLDHPTAGCYRLDGQEVSHLSARELARIRSRKIGFVFQGFNLIAGMDATENVALPLSYRHIPAARRQNMAEDSLRRVGLEHRLHHCPAELSGGQQQRVAIARALVGDPALILADEPTGNLDPRSGAEVLALLRELNRQGKTVLLITHDREIAAGTERVVRMNEGRLTPA